MQNKLPRIFTFVLVLIICGVSVFSQRSNKYTWGIYGGWSVGTGYRFQWHYRPYSDRSTLRYHIGGYVQRNFSPSFGLQLDTNYQKGLLEWTLRHPSLPHNSGEESFDFASLSLKGIYIFPKWGKFQLHLNAGGGISNGEWGGFDGVYYNLTAGPGMKAFLGGADSRLALTLSSAFVWVFELDEWGSDNALYIRVSIGIEF